MAIQEFSSGPIRREVGYLGKGPGPEEEKVFRDRGYTIQPHSDATLRDPARLAGLDSIVFTQSDEKPNRILNDLRTYASLLLDYDCRIYLRVTGKKEWEGKGQEIVSTGLNRLKLPSANLVAGERKLAPFIYVCGAAMGWADIAQLIARNPAGRAPNPLTEIAATDATGKAVDLCHCELLLLRRAFADCSVAHLIELNVGLSGERAFRAYAELEQGLHGHGPSTMPFFVKLGNREKIVAEYDSYQGDVVYLPFHLGPRLNQRRCGLGAFKGVLVGDFVEDAESLKDCASSGRGAQPIATLFNRTLRPWHVRATEKTSSIPDELVELFPSKIPEHRAQMIQELGGRNDLATLKQLFLGRKTSPVFVGPIHADLHANNVLVRATDAIVIDFEKVRQQAPVLYDPASLEAGLLVDGFVDDARTAEEWLESLHDLYHDGALLDGTAHCHPRDASSWFFDAVRQVRLHARQFESQPGQYATALALALIKKSCNLREFPDRRQILRAGAYIIGEIILTARGSGLR